MPEAHGRAGEKNPLSVPCYPQKSPLKLYFCIRIKMAGEILLPVPRGFELSRAVHKNLVKQISHELPL